MKKSSTKPKGATSFQETSFGILPRHKLVKLEIEGVKLGLEWLYREYKEKKEVSITPKFICELHGVCFYWIFPEWAGTYRKIQVTYSGKEAPAYPQVPEFMLNLCNDLSIRLDHVPHKNDEKFPRAIVELLAWFQHKFVAIHPFQDYNGRIARMITIFILLKLQLPPAEITVEKERDRRKYILAMQDADKGDYLRLQELLTKAIIEGMHKNS